METKLRVASINYRYHLEIHCCTLCNATDIGNELLDCVVCRTVWCMLSIELFSVGCLDRVWEDNVKTIMCNVLSIMSILLLDRHKCSVNRIKMVVCVNTNIFRNGKLREREAEASNSENGINGTSISPIWLDVCESSIVTGKQASKRTHTLKWIRLPFSLDFLRIFISIQIDPLECILFI